MRKKKNTIEEPKIINPYENVDSYLEYLKEELNKVEVNLPTLEDLMDKKKNTSSIYTATYLPHPYSDFTRLLDLDKGILTRSISETNKFNLMYLNEYTYPTDEDLIRENKTNNYTRYSRALSICPTFDFKNCPQAFDMLPFIKNGDEYSVNFGHFAINIASDEYQSKLNNAFKNHQLDKPVDSFYIDGANRKKYKVGFSAERCVVYEFEGKQYVRYIVSDLGKEWHTYFTDSCRESVKVNIKGKEYEDGNIVWIEVSNIQCRADMEEKRLVACQCLLRGIPFEIYNSSFKEIDYESSFVKMYLNKFFKPFALKNASNVYNNPITLGIIKEIIKKKKEEEEQTKKEISSSKEKENVTELIGKINDIKRYYLGNENIDEKIKNIYLQYKENIRKLHETFDQEEDTLHLGTVFPENLYKKLIIDYTYIYNILMKDYEKVASYYQMLDILTECQKDDINPNKGELCRLINHAKKCLLPFITNQKRKHELSNQLDELLIRNINTIKKYIEEIKLNPTKKSKTFEELGREFFNEYEELLTKMNKVVKNQEVVNDILESTKLMINNLYDEAKTDTARRFLNQLNEHLSVIRNNGLPRDMEMYIHQQKLNYDVKDIDQIIETLEANIRIAHGIELIVKDRLKRKDELEKYDFDLDPESILASESKQNSK